MKITLVGYMAAGKTTVGKALASRLNLPFLDLDGLIEQNEGVSITTIIQQKGELYFRKLEQETLEIILNQPNFVLSLGGGTPCYYSNMDLVNQHSKSCYLRMSSKTLGNRLANTQHERPLIAHLKNEELTEFVAKHLFERSAFYEEASFIINANDNIDVILKKIEEKLLS